MTLLQLQDVTYRYKNTAGSSFISDHIIFEPGNFIVSLVSQGAGKSTLLSLLAGLDSPVEGSILFQGEDIRNKGYSYHRMHHISLVFQNYNLIDYLSPLENIRLVNKKASKDTLLELGLDESQIKRERSPVIRWSTATCSHRSQFSLRSSSYSSWWANRKSGP